MLQRCEDFQQVANKMRDFRLLAYLMLTSALLLLVAHWNVQVEDRTLLLTTTTVSLPKVVVLQPVPESARSPLPATIPALSCNFWNRDHGRFGNAVFEYATTILATKAYPWLRPCLSAVRGTLIHLCILKQRFCSPVLQKQKSLLSEVFGNLSLFEYIMSKEEEDYFMNKGYREIMGVLTESFSYKYSNPNCRTINHFSK